MSDMEVRKRLWDYILGKSSLDEFKDWFVPSAWDMEKKQGDPSLLALVHEIQLRLAEFSSGHWNEDELRQQLESAVIIHSGAPRASGASIFSSETVNQVAMPKAYGTPKSEPQQPDELMKVTVEA